MITQEQINAATRALRAFYGPTHSSNAPAMKSVLEAAEAAAWLPYDPATMPQEDVLLYWPAAGVDAEMYSVGVACCGDHIWSCDRRDPPTHYRLIVGPKT